MDRRSRRRRAPSCLGWSTRLSRARDGRNCRRKLRLYLRSPPPQNVDLSLLLVARRPTGEVVRRGTPTFKRTQKRLLAPVQPGETTCPFLRSGGIAPCPISPLELPKPHRQPPPEPVPRPQSADRPGELNQTAQGRYPPLPLPVRAIQSGSLQPGGWGSVHLN